MTKDKHKCPPHHFMLNSENVGHCKYCPEVRNFAEKLRREGHLLGSKSKKGGSEGKRGRKKKEPATVAESSAVAKKRWQDPEYRGKQRVAHASLPGRHHKKEELL